MDSNTQEQIFNDWINNYKGLVFKIVRSFAYDEVDREDLFQEVSLQVWNSIPGFKGNSAVSTWIYRVALNTSIRWSQKIRSYNDHKTQLSNQHPVLQYTNEPEDAKVSWLYDQIAKLDSLDKSMIILLLEGYAYKEIAEIIGISESNVGVKLHRIKKVLTQNSKNYVHDGI